VKFKAWLRSIVPVDHLEIICNGQVAREVKLGGRGDTADEEGTLPISTTGWCLLRASSEKAAHPVLDLYPYATTSPIYITVNGSTLHPNDDASYFIAWIDQLTVGAQSNKNWNNETEKQTVLDQLARARKVYEKLRE
jgi:TolB protein